jgi:hypothetical protein
MTRSPGARSVHPLADLENVAGRLVAEHRGHRLGQAAVAGGLVGVADAGRPDPQPDLARARPEHGHIVAYVELLVAADPVENRCPHLATP